MRRELHHPVEIFLALNQIARRRTKVRSPETNGFFEHFHRTVQEEFFGIAFRKTFYESVERLQTDLDVYVDFYNRERAQEAYRTQGRTSYHAFLGGCAHPPQERVA